MTNDKTLYQNYNIPLTMAASPECIFCSIVSDVLPQSCPMKEQSPDNCRRNVRYFNNQSGYTFPVNVTEKRVSIQN